MATGFNSISAGADALYETIEQLCQKRQKEPLDDQFTIISSLHRRNDKIEVTYTLAHNELRDTKIKIATAAMFIEGNTYWLVANKIQASSEQVLGSWQFVSIIELSNKFVGLMPLIRAVARGATKTFSPNLKVAEKDKVESERLLKIGDQFFKEDELFDTDSDVANRGTGSNRIKSLTDSKSLSITSSGGVQIKSGAYIVKAKNTEDLGPTKIIGGRYEIIKELGKGGMGVVYLAEDSLLDNEQVAVKVLPAERKADQRYRDRFMREIKLLRGVNHINVLRTYDFGVGDSYLYYTMEYLTGVSLRELTKQGKIKEADLAPLLLQIARGMRAIHSAGIVHRDLTPNNIVVTVEGIVKLIDFGIARPDQSEITLHDEVLGSIPYIAPEVWRGEKITKAVDLYSFGVIALEVLGGTNPFNKPAVAESIRAHLTEDVDAILAERKDQPRWLNKLCKSLLAKKPEDRMPSFDKVVDVLTLLCP